MAYKDFRIGRSLRIPIDGQVDGNLVVSGTITGTLSGTATSLSTNYVESATAGTGIQVTPAAGVGVDITITNTDRGSSQFIFKDVANSAGTTQFSADSNSTKIRFGAGTFLSATFDVPNKTVTYGGTYTPVNLAGDTMTGNLIINNSTTTDGQLFLRSAAAITTSNVVGGIEFQTADTTVTGFPVTAAYIRAVAENLHNGASYTTGLRFGTTTTATTTEALRITGAGTNAIGPNAQFLFNYNTSVNVGTLQTPRCQFHTVTGIAAGFYDWSATSSGLNILAFTKARSAKTGSHTGDPVTFTVDTTNNLILSTAHGLTAGKIVLLSTTGTLPAGLTATYYYVVNALTDNFQLSATSGGAAIDITDAGTGIHSYVVAGVTESGDVLTRLRGDASDGATFQPACAIDFRTDAAIVPNSTITPGRLQFLTCGSGGTLTEAARINSSQQVLIGLTALANDTTSKLIIDGTTTILNAGNTSGQLILASNSEAIIANEVLGGIEFVTRDTNFGEPGTPTAYIRAIANSTHINASAQDTLLAFGVTDGTTLSEAMRISDSSQLLIGTTALTNDTTSKLIVKGVTVLENTGTTASQLILKSQRTAITTGALIGGIEFYSDDTELTAPGQTCAYIRAYAADDHDDVSFITLDSELRLATWNGNAINECARFTTAGDLRLGADGAYLPDNGDKLQVDGHISLNGDIRLYGASTINALRTTVSNTAGDSLTIKGGDATLAATDKTGGDLILTTGVNTGNAVAARTRIQGYTQGTTTGTTDQTLIDRHIVGITKILTNNTNVNLVSCAVANNTVAAGIIKYAIEVFNGTDLQIEEGILSYHVTNKAATVANNVILKSSNQQAMTSGTLTVTFSMTAANPSVIRVNANSSLTPSTGYPRITYTVDNLTQQAITLQ